MTTNLLIFFAIPLAIIVISIALQKNLRNPFLVAAIVFSIALVIVLSFFDPIYLIAVVAYTVLAFLTALLTCLLCGVLRNSHLYNCIGCGGSNSSNANNNMMVLEEGKNEQYNSNSNTYCTGYYRKK
ncbi:MAG: YbeF family protein [Clostridia bacterium]|nr:YbeF family protein [Clostridia bacterium]